MSRARVFIELTESVFVFISNKGLTVVLAKPGNDDENADCRSRSTIAGSLKKVVSGNRESIASVGIVTCTTHYSLGREKGSSIVVFGDITY